MSKVIVVGGGAAGMMAAIAAGKNGNSVELYEKNEKLGKKLFITGKGRCNVTNAADVETLLNNVVRNRKFLYSAFYGFDNMALCEMIEEAGCKLKTERGDRVFPESDHSSDIIKALEKLLQKYHVSVHLKAEVKSILAEDGEAKGIKLSDGKKIFGDAVIVCTGGYTYPLTGSTGDGYRFAKDTGHTITEVAPSLVPFETSEKWAKDLMGLSLKNVNLTLISGKKKLYDGFGEMLFTHFGISGPLVLTASCYYDDKKYPDCKVIIDLKPALSLEQLDKRLIREFEANVNKQFDNALASLLPSKMIPVMVELSGIPADKKIHDITKQERADFAALLKHVEMNITGTRGPEEAIITRGGVSVKEIDPGTMESKSVKGLYFAGEVLDLDAVTGGFNLQIAWSTGYAAGNYI
ncbi:MAG: NAD(P)/FAD-dependent oxidoreductase [Lachnospiraceae bacterium]|nr:NAD(P)/FAD-dependent oxidoreductase [Lachnospiraceae bacterium]